MSWYDMDDDVITNLVAVMKNEGAITPESVRAALKTANLYVERVPAADIPGSVLSQLFKISRSQNPQ